MSASDQYPTHLSYAAILKSQAVSKRYKDLNSKVNGVVFDALYADPECTQVQIRDDLFNAIMREDGFKHVLTEYGYKLQGRTLSWEEEE